MVPAMVPFPNFPHTHEPAMFLTKMSQAPEAGLTEARHLHPLGIVEA